MLRQQGDVLMFTEGPLPEGVKKVQKSKETGRLILAEGEATGHAHAIVGTDVDNCTMYEDSSGTIWLTVEDDVTVLHEEHNAVKLAPGNYRVGIVREVDPFESEIRSVVD